MTAPHEVVPFDPSATMQVGAQPAGPQPPNGSHASWPGVAQEVVRQGGGALERHQDRAVHREPRPRASTLAVVAMASVVGLAIVGVVVVVGLVTWHQMGTGDYERRQLDRHNEVMKALRDQKVATYGLIDVVAVHHPEAAKVGDQLQRATTEP